MTAFEPDADIKMRSAIITSLIIILSSVSNADEDAWEPSPKFQLENAGYKETLTWVSGVSYGLSSLYLGVSRKTGKTFLCGTKSIGSRELFSILNNEHDGERISAEQAMSTIMSRLEKLYPCGESIK